LLYVPTGYCEPLPSPLSQDAGIMTFPKGSPPDSPSPTTPDSASPALAVRTTDRSAHENEDPPPSVGAANTNWHLAAIVTAAFVVGVAGFWAMLPRLAPFGNSAPSGQPSAASNHPPPLERPSPSGSPPEALAPTKTTWGSGEMGWATDGSRMLTFELDSEHDVPVWTTNVRPVLGVRCLARTVEIFVLMKSAASIEPTKDRHTVRVGFDQEPDATEQWDASIDSQALFAPDGSALSRRIARAHVMRFGFTPFHASPVEAQFDVREFNRPLEAVARICRMKSPARG
jgi:hypothetical protein